jgi:hypothetical protein
MPYKSPEHKKANGVAYRKANKQRLDEYHKRYVAEHKPQMLAAGRKYYAKNKARLQEYSKQYRLDHAESIKAKAKYRRDNDPGGLRRARKRASYHKHKEGAGIRKAERNRGMPLGGFEIMLREQDNRCGICRITQEEYIAQSKKRFAIDHCHTKGHNRGLLCAPCNIAIGLLRDDPKILRNAIKYLKER